MTLFVKSSPSEKIGSIKKRIIDQFTYKMEQKIESVQDIRFWLQNPEYKEEQQEQQDQQDQGNKITVEKYIMIDNDNDTTESLGLKDDDIIFMTLRLKDLGGWEEVSIQPYPIEDDPFADNDS
ncbi:hypothetical protein H4219_004702 [Mycoemilia scoparia]|uniref:Uncharacterized protein n=1 Tax=Mycoemilia scoparia TaxID=417184 RepID=A0A9W8DME4_9FUNG|nr:hypothetical protein H4219_004702 [Mycoemilia scoparia]